MKKINLSKKQIITVVIVLVISTGGLAWWLMSKNNQQNQETEEQVTYYSALTGNEINEQDATRPILGIMVENSEFARPQTGLGSAGIVFEAVTEGGITRYLALYQEDQPELVGPVRSLRPHFLDWAMGLNASIAHVGGSATALQLAEERSAKSLTQFIYEAPYYREPSREAPHDVFVRTQALRELQQELEHTAPIFSDIPRKDDAPALPEEREATSIQLNFSAPAFTAGFTYDATTNNYARTLAGTPDIDQATNRQIAVKNLAVLITSSPGEGVVATGSGKAIVFMDGKRLDATWEQSRYSERIQLLDSSGQEIALNHGTTWITAITNLNQATITADD